MNNKRIMVDAQKLYNPKTAFGNEKLIGLLKKIKVPNNKGNFEVVGEKIVKIIGVEWECVSCGKWNKDEVIEVYSGYEDVKTQCKNCKAKHTVEISN